MQRKFLREVGALRLPRSPGPDADRASEVRAVRIILVVLEALLALNAAGGGIYGLTGAAGVPREWLQGSPFESFFVPSLILIAVVGGSALVAATLVVLRPPLGAWASLGAAAILFVWIAVQVGIIGLVSWLQPTCIVLALVIGGLAVALRRREHAAYRLKITKTP